MKNNLLNEEKKRMQKLSGIVIKEGEADIYNAEELNYLRDKAAKIWQKEDYEYRKETAEKLFKELTNPNIPKGEVSARATNPLEQFTLGKMLKKGLVDSYDDEDWVIVPNGWAFLTEKGFEEIKSPNDIMDFTFRENNFEERLFDLAVRMNEPNFKLPGEDEDFDYLRETDKIRLVIRNLISEVFGKSIGLPMGMQLDMKKSRKTLYTPEEVVKLIENALIDEDWKLVEEVKNNLSANYKIIPSEMRVFLNALKDATLVQDWKMVSDAKKILKNKVALTEELEEIFGKSLGIDNDDELNKKSKMAGWLDKKPTSRQLYPVDTIKKMLDDAILEDDWDIINDIVNNVSFRKMGHVPLEIEELGDSLADASNESDWHKVSVARKKFKGYTGTNLN